MPQPELKSNRSSLSSQAAKDMRPGICAKIAAQGAELYAEAGRLLGKEAIRALFEKEWLNTVRAKESAFLVRGT